MPMLYHVGPLIVCAAMLAFTASAPAQDYPARVLRLVIPFPPGAGNDIIGRMVATELGTRLGKQVVVDNRTGAGGTIGAEHVASAAPDGYTLLLMSSAHTTNPWLYKLTYDPLKSFEPITILASAPALLAVHPSVPATTLQEFIALAQAKPGQLHMAHGGFGGFMHTSGALFARSAGIDVVEVPFKGAGPAIINLLGGDTQFLLVPLSALRAHLSSGKLRALAIAAEKRAAQVPDVPTMAEQGLAGFTAANWYGIVAPAGTPRPILERLHSELSAVQDLPRITSQLESEGAHSVKMSSAEFGRYIEAELRKWEPIVKRAGMKAQ